MLNQGRFCALLHFAEGREDAMAEVRSRAWTRRQPVAGPRARLALHGQLEPEGRRQRLWLWFRLGRWGLRNLVADDLEGVRRLRLWRLPPRLGLRHDSASSDAGRSYALSPVAELM